MTLDKGYQIPFANSIRYPCQGRRNNIMYNLKTVTTMLEHEIKNKVLTIGNRKGQTVYYAYPKSQQYFTASGSMSGGNDDNYEETLLV